MAENHTLTRDRTRTEHVKVKVSSHTARCPVLMQFLFYSTARLVNGTPSRRLCATSSYAVQLMREGYAVKISTTVYSQVFAAEWTGTTLR